MDALRRWGLNAEFNDFPSNNAVGEQHVLEMQSKMGITARRLRLRHRPASPSHEPNPLRLPLH
jgi:hypothetical protein